MSSFQRRGKQAAIQPRGTRPSAFNAQLLCSSGLADLDTILGGGLAMGTVLVVGEDPLSHYVDTLSAYFMAEAVACGHPLAVVDPCGQTVEDCLASLPWPSSSAEAEAPGPPPKLAGSGLKIAWQYAKYTPATGKAEGHTEASSSRPAAPSLCQSYSFGCRIPQATLDTARPHICHIPVGCGPSRPAGALCDDVFTQLADFVSVQTALAVARGLPESSLLFRVLFRDFGGLGWGVPRPDTDQHLARLFFRLTGLVRTQRMVATVTVPNIRADLNFFRRLCHMADAAIELKSWAGAGVPVSAFEAGEYTGRLDIIKLPRVNSLVAFHNGVSAFGFTVRSTGRLTIARFSLPPSDDVVEGNAAPHPGTDCGLGTGLPPALDF